MKVELNPEQLSELVNLGNRFIQSMDRLSTALEKKDTPQDRKYPATVVPDFNGR